MERTEQDKNAIFNQLKQIQGDLINLERKYLQLEKVVYKIKEEQIQYFTDDEELEK